MQTGARRWLLAACCLTIGGFTQPAQAQAITDCEQAGRAAEQRFGIPDGLLLAIGRVESGRWDAQLGRVVPWPWAVDVDGAGHLYNDGNEALNATRATQVNGRHSIDVGCFQINLQSHPDAFPDLNQAFDPQANARYAARLLSSLRVRLGNWQDAVAAYHSATAELGVPYRQLVFATWSGAAPAPIAAAQFPAFPGIHVWVPSAAGTAPEVIAMRTYSVPTLPRVITPAR